MLAHPVFCARFLAAFYGLLKYKVKSAAAAVHVYAEFIRLLDLAKNFIFAEYLGVQPVDHLEQMEDRLFAALRIDFDRLFLIPFQDRSGFDGGFAVYFKPVTGGQDHARLSDLFIQIHKLGLVPGDLCADIEIGTDAKYFKFHV